MIFTHFSAAPFLLITRIHIFYYFSYLCKFISCLVYNGSILCEKINILWGDYNVSCYNRKYSRKKYQGS